MKQYHVWMSHRIVYKPDGMFLAIFGTRDEAMDHARGANVTTVTMEEPDGKEEG